MILTERDGGGWGVGGLSQCHFVNQNQTWSGLGLNTDLGGQKLVTNSLSHGVDTVC